MYAALLRAAAVFLHCPRRPPSAEPSRARRYTGAHAMAEPRATYPFVFHRRHRVQIATPPNVVCVCMCVCCVFGGEFMAHRSTAHHRRPRGHVISLGGRVYVCVFGRRACRYTYAVP